MNGANISLWKWAETESSICCFVESTASSFATDLLAMQLSRFILIVIMTNEKPKHTTDCDGVECELNIMLLAVTITTSGCFCLSPFNFTGSTKRANRCTCTQSECKVSNKSTTPAKSSAAACFLIWFGIPKGSHPSISYIGVFVCSLVSNSLVCQHEDNYMNSLQLFESGVKSWSWSPQWIRNSLCGILITIMARNEK